MSLKSSISASAPGDLGLERLVVADVGEFLLVRRQQCRGIERVDLGVERRAMQAVAEHPAEEVLLGGNRVDQGRSNVEDDIAQVHVGRRRLPEPGARIAGSDRHDVQLLAAGGP